MIYQWVFPFDSFEVDSTKCAQILVSMSQVIIFCLQEGKGCFYLMIFFLAKQR